VGLLTSAVWAIGNGFATSANCDNGGCGTPVASHPPPTWLPVTSLVALAVGAVLLPIGLTMPHGPSTVTQVPTVLGGSNDVAYEALRPVWREAPTEASIAPRPVGIPLTSLAF